MNKHAYLIMAHHNQGQLRKLIELLDNERNDIFVHVDRKAVGFNADEWRDVCRHSALVFLDDRIDVRWGGVSLIRCEMNLLKSAVANGEYLYYHLLSGADLPIKTQAEIHDFFDRHNGTEFINYWERNSILKKRFNYYSPFPEGERTFITRRINHLAIKLQRYFGYSINRDIDFRYASQWFSITDRMAKYVLSREEWIESVFKHTVLCDEVFLATVAWNSPYREYIYMKDESSPKDANLSNMRFIDWTRGESIRHPWTFRADDWELLMSVPHLWARKFDEKLDPQIIDRIYNHLKTEHQ